MIYSERSSKLNENKCFTMKIQTKKNSSKENAVEVSQ